MPECKPLDLGGRTIENPCLSAWGYYCSPWDYWATRKILQVERNVLVDRLTAYNELVRAGKASWVQTPNAAALSAAYHLANGASWQLLADYGDSNWNIFRDGQQAEQPARAFVEMATRCHAAICDVDAALESGGHTTPKAPAPPVPPQTIEDRILTFTLGVAKVGAVGVIAVVGSILALRWVKQQQGEK